MPQGIHSVQRKSSFDRARGMVNGSRGGGLSRTKGVSRGHDRTWSDSTTVNTRQRSGSLNPNSRSNASVVPFESCIKFGEPSDLGKVSKLLITLQALIPPSRTPDPAPPPPNTAFLHPTTLITPLAIILEALVVEREILKDSHASTSPRLPLLRGGSSFQLSGGDGELDWRVTKAYILAFGSLLSSILPLLVNNAERGKVEELMKMVTVYVGKMKKVFGEIAGMYVDGYGFLKGWWDDGGMKGAAGEVGKWGDLFDA